MCSLVIDIGNTYYKIYVFENDNVCHQCVTPILTCEELNDLCKRFNPENAILSTTRQAEPELNKWLENNLQKFILFDPAKTPVPINNNYATPNTLGADRLAAAVAAAQIFPKKDVLIMDFGTALTIDLVTADNTFQGGNISLGYSSRLLALHNQTGRLPLLNAPENPKPNLLGNSTTSAMQNGVFNSMLYEIEGYVQHHQDKTILFTGGEAKYFVNSVKNTIFADYQLVPKGLNRILEYNAKNS